MRRFRQDDDRVKIIRALLDGTSTAPELVAVTGASMATVYARLRAMTRDGWLTKTAIAGTGRRTYEVTPVGRRALRFILDLAYESEDDSRSSSPTAARNSP